MPPERRGPICGASNPCWRPTRGSTGILDPAAPTPTPPTFERPGARGLEGTYGKGAVALYASAGGLPEPSCVHTPDSAGWTKDLLYHYLYDKRHTPTGRAYALDPWLGAAYPAALTSRHRVYDLLVQSAETEWVHDQGASTGNPKKPRNTSRIPWNQLNPGWRIHVQVTGANGERTLKLCDPKSICGSVVKAFFSKYMFWSELAPQALPSPVGVGAAVPPQQKVRLEKILDAIRSQLDKARPVRAFMRHWDGTVPHYIGIVGYKADRFLCIEPWAGNNHGVAYGNKARKSRFLAVLRPDPTRNALVYLDGMPYVVRAVDVPGPV